MAKKYFYILFLFSIVLASCSKESEEVEPEAPVAAFAGKYEFKSLELNIDGHLLEIPNDLKTKELIFKTDGTFTYPEDLVFYDGKYEFNDSQKILTFIDDSDPKSLIKSTLTVQKNNSEVKLKSKPTGLDNLNNLNEYEANILLFSTLSIDESDPKVVAWQNKIGANSKNLSFEFTLIKK